MSYKIWTVAREAGKRITAEIEENVYSQVYICTQVKKKASESVYGLFGARWNGIAPLRSFEGPLCNQTVNLHRIRCRRLKEQKIETVHEIDMSEKSTGISYKQYYNGKIKIAV